MPKFTGFLILAIAFFMWLVPCRAEAASRQEVRDHAHLFDAAALERVQTILGQIHREFGKDVTIETFPAIPADLQGNFEKRNKDEFYEDWVRQQAIAADTNGVFILICQHPGRLQIGVGNRTGKLFTNADRDALRDRMVKQLHQRQYDDALIDGVTFVLKRMEANQPQAGPDTTVTPTTRPAKASESQPTTEPASKRDDNK